jgi:methanogenic corrinoid protein MtbC1
VKSTTHLFAVNVRNKYEEKDATLVGASALLTTTML